MKCAECKGRLLCGRSRCPLLEKIKFMRHIKIGDYVKDETPPSVFIGRIGYPKVYAGPLIAIDVDPIYADSPWMWSSIEEAIKLRVSLLRASKKVRVDSIREPEKFVLDIQELAAAIKPVDIEADIKKLNKKPEFDDVIQPMGYSALVERINVAENPKIPDKVEKIYYDELKASDSLMYLFEKGFSTYYLQKIFSVGILGLPENRKLVPTRWSITAVHSIIGDQIKRQLSDLPSINEYLVFSYEHFGNHFEILLSPGNFFFQLIEAWRRKSFWSPNQDWIGADSEDLRPKRQYSPLGGGYYAARLPVLEYLWKIRRQASVLVIREIKPSYYAPLGVWVVEEGVRRALKSKPSKFDTMKDALNCIASKLEIKKEKWTKLVFTQYSLQQFFEI